MKQGKASRDVAEGAKREPRPYAINQNFPSQIGTAIDPRAVEKMRLGKGFRGTDTSAAHMGPTDGMEQGPGGNREVMRNGGQGKW